MSEFYLGLIELVGLVCLPVFLILELFWRDQPYRLAKFWRGRAAIITLVNFHLSAYVAMFWSGLFGDRHLFDGSVLGAAGGAAVGVLAYELVHYGYHRLAHTWKPLWRAAHQMHHSAESLDAFGAFYLHPVDNAFFTTWASLVFFPVLGLSMEAGLIATTFLTFNAVFQHANIRTPRWVGFFIQRPESHRIHHARGVHRFNYSDLPLWDMVFGTFQNPSGPTEMAMGFYDGASARVGEMMIGLNVTRPKAAKAPAAPALVGAKA